MDLTIRRCGTLIDLGVGEQGAVPDQVVALLHPVLSYVYRKYQHGRPDYDVLTGERQKVTFEERAMYRIENGRLTTCYGLVPRIIQTLSRHGYRVEVTDISPPRPRPDAYVPDWDAVRREIVFRPRQLECLEAIARNPGGVIKAPTGFGKTHLIYALAVLYPRAKIDVVIKSKDVAARIVRQLSAHLPLVGMVGGGRRRRGRVTVYTADSLHHSDGDADFLLGDEGHQLVAPRVAEVLGRVYRFSRNYAFTATPSGRFDGADARLEMFFGPQIFTMEYAEAVDLGLVVPVRVRWLPFRMERNPIAGVMSDTSRKRHGIWRNEERNRLIADDARRHYADKQVLILVETVEHAVFLWQHLPEYSLCYANLDEVRLAKYQRWELVPPDFEAMTPQRREAMRLAFERGELKKVIATDVWATGVDFASLQVVYSVSGRQSEIWDTQGPGRVSRTYDGKEYGEVVDVLDTFDARFLAKAQARYRHYRKLGWVQDWPYGRRAISAMPRPAEGDASEEAM